jgi:hypothetical protein
MFLSTPAPVPTVTLKAPLLDFDNADTSDPGYSSATESDASIDASSSLMLPAAGLTRRAPPLSFSGLLATIPGSPVVGDDHVDINALSGGSDREDSPPPIKVRPPPGLEVQLESEQEMNVLSYGPHGSPKRRLKQSAALLGTEGSVLAYGPHGSPKRNRLGLQKTPAAADTVLAYGPHGSPNRLTCRHAPRQVVEAVATAAAEAEAVAGEPVFSYGPHGSPKKAHEPVLSYGPHGSPQKCLGSKNLLAPAAANVTTKRVAKALGAAAKNMPAKISLTSFDSFGADSKQFRKERKERLGKSGKLATKLSPAAPEFKLKEGNVIGVDAKAPAFLLSTSPC